MDKTSAAYRRMDKTIINAFVELAQTMSFEKITVQKIVDAALISRYTFYTHFHDNGVVSLTQVKINATRVVKMARELTK